MISGKETRTAFKATHAQKDGIAKKKLPCDNQSALLSNITSSFLLPSAYKSLFILHSTSEFLLSARSDAT